MLATNATARALLAVVAIETLRRFEVVSKDRGFSAAKHIIFETLSALLQQCANFLRNCTSAAIRWC